MSEPVVTAAAVKSTVDGLQTVAGVTATTVGNGFTTTLTSAVVEQLVTPLVEVAV